MRPGERGSAIFNKDSHRPIAHIAQLSSVVVSKAFVDQPFIIDDRKKSRYFVTSLICRDFATKIGFCSITQ